ncbi:MAG: DUF2628 domain-containing protein [Geminicoccaceae bacterium]|nr:DUF2628 domain-containing protein [Geminicoccaceae bacterium]
MHASTADPLLQSPPSAIPAAAIPSAAPPSAASPNAAGEDVAIDAARAFLGPHASYYDESWRVMNWRGRRTSWNRHAALFGPVWFAYRRMLVPAVLLLAWVHGLLTLYRMGWSVTVLAGLQVTMMIAVGWFANALYLHRFQRIAARLARLRAPPLEREGRFAARGGVSPLLAAAVGAALIAGILLGLTLDRPV